MTTPPLHPDDERDLLRHYSGLRTSGGGGRVSGNATQGAMLERAAAEAYSFDGAISWRAQHYDRWQTMKLSPTRNVVPPTGSEGEAGSAQGAVERRLASVASLPDGPRAIHALRTWYGEDGAFWARHEAGRRWALAGLTETALRDARRLLRDHRGGGADMARALGEALLRQGALVGLGSGAAADALRLELLRRVDREIEDLADAMRAAWHATPPHRSRAA